MASTNKTPKLGLNQWAAGDEVLRTDFNGDNAKLDAAVGALQARKVGFGTYTGVPGFTATKSIDVGFRPQIVLIMGDGSDIATCTVLMIRGHDVVVGGQTLCRMTETGFEVFTHRNGDMPVTPALLSHSFYTYLAFC